MQSMAYTAVDDDPNKLFSISDYINNVEQDLSFGLWGGYGFGGIMSTLRHRIPYLQTHSEISQTPPTLYGLSVSNNVITINATNESSVELMATKNELKSKFQSFDMYDDGTNGDIQANDGVYSCYIPFPSALKVNFYIKAKNFQTIMLSPERAEYEFYEYSSLSGITNYPQSNTKELIKITDLLGRRASFHYNTPLLYIYTDGSVEKKIIAK